MFIYDFEINDLRSHIYLSCVKPGQDVDVQVLLEHRVRERKHRLQY